MAREIPEVVRAAAGLAATVLDEARKLPETLPGLPVRLIGLAMQHAMKVQQQYAGLVARGDELFTGLRGEDEPGLATFDDDEDEPPAASTGFRDSAFDRADAEPTSADVDLIIDEEVATAKEAPDAEEILDEIAIDELVDQAPTLEETAPAVPAPAKKAAAKKAPPAKKTPPAKKSAAAKKSATDAPAKAAKATPTAQPQKSAQADDVAAEEAALLEAAIAAPDVSNGAAPQTAASPTAGSPTADSPTAADTLDAESTADVATTGDDLRPAGDDAAVAAPESPAATPAADASTGGASTGGASTGGASTGSEATGSKAPRTAPVDGYDSFSVAQLRGRLRGYALSTVEELISYERATRDRSPYLTILRNRLEKLEEQAIESSPLAPRGA